MSNNPPGRYGRRHQETRERALQQFRDGDLCGRCFQPMYAYQGIDLDHDDDDPTRYRGLSHSTCNSAAGGAKGGATTAERYFGKVKVTPAAIPPGVCSRCGSAHCLNGREPHWHSRCW
jgi:hypothetical protein